MLHTDHEPLKFLRDQKQLTDRQFRWVQYMEKFNYAIKYCKGSRNPADAPSRRPDYELPTLAVLQGGEGDAS